MSFVSLNKDYYVPDPDQWDFEGISEALKTYPSHISYLIDTNKLILPNFLTGDPGDGAMSVRVDLFFDSWIKNIYDLIYKPYIQALSWHQTS